MMGASEHRSSGKQGILRGTLELRWAFLLATLLRLRLVEMLPCPL